MDYPCGRGPVKGKKVIEPMTKEDLTSPGGDVTKNR
jgi:hypothetical protein